MIHVRPAVAAGTPPRGQRLWQLPRRDYILLPFIFVTTMIALLVCGEIVTRLIYKQVDAIEPCEYSTANGFRYKPFCTSQTKVWDGDWITQHFNDCGYHTAESCAPRPAGALRVAVVGSSTARGTLVNYADSFAARASAMLSQRCGGLVDFQNLGTEPWDMHIIDRRMAEALSLGPSAIVMTVGPYDLIHLNDALPERDEDLPPLRFNLHMALRLLRESRLFVVMQSYLYRDPAFQIDAFLLNGDPADYVRAPLTATWQQRLADFGVVLGRMTAQTAPAHVPVLLFYFPERAQAALAKASSRPAGVDPLALGRALQTVAAQHGVAFFDATTAFASMADFQSLFT